MGLRGWLTGEAKRNQGSTPEATPTRPSQPPDQRFVDELTPLMETNAGSGGGGKANVELWRAVFAVPQWHFLARCAPGVTWEMTLASGSIPALRCSSEADRRLVAVFTSGERAQAAGVLNKIPDANDGFAVLSVPTEAAVSLVLRDQGVDGVVVNKNLGDAAFTSPREGVAAMFEWCMDRLPDGGLDPFLCNESERPSRQGAIRVARRLIRDRSQLFFVGDETRPGSPLLFPLSDTEVFLCLFTDQQRAAIGGGAIPGVGPGKTVTAIPTNPADALAFGLRLQEHSKGVVRGFTVNLGTSASVVPFDAWREGLSAARE